MLQYDDDNWSIMARVHINAEGCKACMLCIEFCPRDCLEMSEELNSRGFHPAVMSDTARCTGCRVCALMCPDVCIKVFRDIKSDDHETRETG